MNANPIVLLTAAILTIGATAAAASDQGRSALAQAADRVGGLAIGHDHQHPDSNDGNCDGYRNHGDYVSSVANANRSDEEDSDENEADEADDGKSHNDRANRTHPNRTVRPDHDEANETDDNESAEASGDDGHGAMVREAAHSEIGKCAHRNANGSGSHGETEAADAGAEAEDRDEHGRSGQARSDHPPRRTK